DRARLGGRDDPPQTARPTPARGPRGAPHCGGHGAAAPPSGRRSPTHRRAERGLTVRRGVSRGRFACTIRAWPCLTLAESPDYPRPSFAPAKHARERGEVLPKAETGGEN